MFTFELEKYRNKSSRHTCPSCGARHEFARYVDAQGNYLADDVGRCNRESSCEYHKKPKDFFAENAEFAYCRSSSRPARQSFAPIIENAKPNFIDFEILRDTLGNYDQNSFVQFLTNLFPDRAADVFNVLKMYFVGTYQDYTCFPSIDRLNRICRAKLIRFDPATGKRMKGDYDTSSLPAKLKFKDFNYKQLFFGEHLLSRFPNKPVAIVEAEKSAIIGALCFPEFVWLGSNSKSWLNAERLKQIGDRRIILYPDADGFQKWQEIAREASFLGSLVKVSGLIENNATPAQKADGCDLADYLRNQQIEKLEKIDKYAAEYNAAVDSILSDADLLAEFETILDERKAILIVDGEMGETDAEIYICQPDNLRNAALSVVAEG